ncbi:hypothetical protein GCM10022243_22950 [Saccharothrix violaceirubra]|uniref:GNAT superfamily N-acetyltransferase n=1 Tax=Saccharothrix violaceirubra TaxID=413306 RepID=A0A7W7T1C8_9PSEU|nr:GNAT family N-acetyltransferase [Saccharothrix violaceirubra]MBB4964768.1 GNAT superfamily N-acetyltransferase [Saccharothrix violaceirubra]
MTTSGVTTRYLMRPGRAADRPQIANLVRARAAWMRDVGFGRWVGWDRNADELASQAGSGRWPTWVLCSGDRDVLGVTTAAVDTPDLGWGAEERAESAIFLQSTATDPRFARRGLGMIIAFWALDQAAREGRAWVRRGVLTIGRDNRGLVRYYRTQGWRIVRAVPHPRKHGVTVWSLQRPAERQPELGEFVAW